MRGTVVVLVVIAASGVAACGDDDDGATDTAAPTVSAAGPGTGTAEPPSTADEEADQAAAESALLVLADFPTGWSEVPRAELTEAQEEANRRSAECFGVDAPRLVDFGGAFAETGEFTSPSDESVSEAVGLAPTPADAEERLESLRDPDAVRCFRDVTRDAIENLIENPPSPEQALPEGTTIRDVTVDPLDVSPAGEDIVALRATVSLSVDSSTVDVYADLVAVRSGRAVASMEFESEVEPFPIEDTERYIELAAERLDQVS
jgi:hypothetical protein